MPRFAILALFCGLAACSGDASEAIALGQQAQQQLEAKQHYAARETIRKAVEERDDLPALQLLRGRIELAGNRLGPAFEAYAAALSLEATNPEALQGVAQLGLRTGHIDESEDAADRILALQPDQTDALLIKGLLALVRHRPTEAIGLADRILTDSPDNEGGTILKARALHMQGNLKDALDLVGKLDPAVAKSEGLMRTRLELMREASDAPGMLAEFAALRQLLPKDSELRLDEANLRYKTGDVARARDLLRSALFEMPLTASQTTQIAALWREYDPEPLDPGALRTLAMGSKDAARLEIARFYLDTGRPRAARALLSRARSLEARSLAARAAIAEGETARGAAAADAILAQDKTQCDALLARSAAAAAARNWSAAVIAAQTAAAECSHAVSASLALARAYEGRQDTAGVRRAFAEGIAQNPQDAVLSRAFSAWLEAQGQSRQSIAEARRLTRKAPALVSGWLAYRDICNRQQDESCAAEARAGLTQAATILGVDLPPGTPAVRGLLGRLPAR